MKNLGKIVLLLSLFSMTLFGSVIASLQQGSVHVGDTVTYMLTITGKDIKRPLLSDICGHDITATGSQTSIESINGSYSKSYTLSYEFTAQKSCTIAPVNVMVDGHEESSNSVKLDVKPISQNLNADFVLTLKSAKKELYVGEPFTLTMYLKQNKNAQAADSKFIAPKFKGFWIKSQGQQQRTQNSDSIITKVVYNLAAQREGNLTIEPAQLKIATRVGSSSWGMLMPQVRWRTYYSNSVNLHIKPLPNKAKLIGNFKISATAEKTEVNPNEAVKVTVEVDGEGNLEDIESFKPYLNGVNVFDEKINIKGNKLTQKLVFVGDSDFTIAPFKLHFFNPKTKRVEEIKTRPIHIKVNGNVKKKALVVKSDTNSETNEAVAVTKPVKMEVQNNYLYIGLAFVIGLLLGASLLFFKGFKSEKKATKIDLNNEKLLLIKLLPYKESDAEIAKIVAILEQNIYSSKKEKIDKKVLKELIKRYNIS